MPYPDEQTFFERNPYSDRGIFPRNRYKSSQTVPSLTLFGTDGTKLSKVRRYYMAISLELLHIFDS